MTKKVNNKIKDNFKDSFFYRPNPTEVIKDKEKYFKDIFFIKYRPNLSNKILELASLVLIQPYQNNAIVIDSRKVFLQNPEARNHNDHMKQKSKEIILSELVSTKHVNQRKKSLFELLNQELLEKAKSYTYNEYITGLRFKGASIEKSRDISSGDERYRRVMLYNVMEGVKLYAFSLYSPRERDEIKFIGKEKIQGPQTGSKVDIKVPSRKRIFSFDNNNNQIPFYYNIKLENYPTKHNEFKYGIAINFKTSNIGDEVSYTKYLEERFPNKNVNQEQQEPPIEISAETIAGNLELIKHWVELYKINFKRTDKPMVLEQTYIPLPNQTFVNAYDLLRNYTIIQEEGKLRPLKANELETALWDMTFNYIAKTGKIPFSLDETPGKYLLDKKRKIDKYIFTNKELELFH